MISRRTFIKNSGLLTAALYTNKAALFQPPIKSIGLQLYTLREVLNKNSVREVIEKIAAIGYKEIEIPGYSSKDKFWGLDSKAFKVLLDANWLKATSVHYGFDEFLLTGKDDELKRVCDAAKAIGSNYLVLPWVDEKLRKKPEDYKRIAEKLNIAATLCRKFELQFAYHNHDFEFKEFSSGKNGFAMLLDETDKSLVQFELDLYWATKGGKDPVQLIEQNPGRFSIWHVKDMDRNTRSFTEVGSGVIDFKKIFNKMETSGLKHFFIEQDLVYKNEFDSIRQSFDYVKKNLL